MRRDRFAFGLALVMAIATYLLILLGGVVHNTGSSLACPDWPLCYGTLFPEMKGGILYEHSHRILGALVGLCAIGLVVAFWPARPPHPRRRGRAIILLLLVIFQGTLGGLTVIYKLPTLISTAHLATSMIVLMLVVSLCRAAWLRLRPSAAGPLVSPPDAGEAFTLFTITTVAVYVQLLLGALIRHTGLSEAAGWGPSAMFIGTDISLSANPLTLWPRTLPGQLNMLHRYAAVLVALMVFLCCARAWSLMGDWVRRGRVAIFLMPGVLAMMQILVGMTMLATWNLKLNPGLAISDALASAIQITMRTAHLGIGALLLLSLFYLAMISGQAALPVRLERTKPDGVGVEPSLQPS